jgi:hypothetical protein
VSIQPYRRAPIPRPVGVLTEAGTVLQEDGSRVALADVTPHTTLYASWRTVTRRAHRGIGRLYYLHDTPIRYEERAQPYYANGERVYILPDDTSTYAEMLEGLTVIRDFLASKGAAGTSTTARSVSLLRASLERPLYTWGGTDPVPLNDVIGGRQETVRYGIWRRDFIGLDISGAYFNTLGGLHYSGRWSEVDIGDVITERHAFHHARVMIPAGLDIGPLPRRRRGPAKGTSLDRQDAEREYPTGEIRPGRGGAGLVMKGLWTGVELASAIGAGCEVKVDRTWIDVGPTEARPFGTWHAWIDEARALDGIAGVYGKMLGNVLIGWFQTRDAEVRWHEWNDDNTPRASGKFRIHPRAKFQSPLDLAELVTSSVRARLNTDIFTPHASRVIGCHTDGVFLTGSELNPIPDGWRVKHRGTGICFIHPQVWAYRDVDGWHYCYSGIPASEVPRAFNESATMKFGRAWKRQIPTTREEPWQTQLAV